MLVAGTQIGAGMLALPIETGVSGFPASTVLFLLCFAYMVASLFLLLEANYYSKNTNINMISMSREHIGSIGAVVATIAFTLLMYAALSAYINAANQTIGSTLNALHLGFINQDQVLPIIIALLFSIIIYFGSSVMDYTNRILIAGLVLSYFLLIFNLLPEISYKNLNTYHFEFLIKTIPVVVLSFTSHIILPSLREFLDDDLESIKKVLIWGSVIPLVAYLLWNMVIIGIIPYQGSVNIVNIATAAKPIVAISQAIGTQAHSSIISNNNDLFAFCAIATSIIGVLLSLKDFIADGLKVNRTKFNNVLLLLTCILPPLLWIYLWPSSFTSALGYGGVCIAVLYGILPPIMAWKARYQRNITSKFTLPGGKASLVIIALGGIVIILSQLAFLQGLLPTP